MCLISVWVDVSSLILLVFVIIINYRLFTYCNLWMALIVIGFFGSCFVVAFPLLRIVLWFCMCQLWSLHDFGVGGCGEPIMESACCVVLVVG